MGLDLSKVVNLAEKLLALAPAAIPNIGSAISLASQLVDAITEPDPKVSQDKFDAVHAEHDAKRAQWLQQLAISKAETAAGA